MTKLAVSAIIAILCTGCGNSKSDEKAARREKSLTYFEIQEKHKASMDAAVQRAKSEIEHFVQALEHPKSTQSDFSVKKGFPCQDGDAISHEHIWLTNVTYKDGKFHGQVGNDPVNIVDVKVGDEVEVEKSEASDWMFIDDGWLVGGYTVVELRAQMGEEERKVFDASVPFKVKPD
jgi:uncharacterized protein YegJ (DUF2314 family)